ncbi:leucyl aminopeptidase family protein [Oceanobacter mangrovi]|uniref:leucyl aminopeptidase family protein n=1 Tax=Oceanobacter mangrovi TaxID=2862510 RepID=UPI001C8F1A6E|nr:leucyl aminopeptidase family protein [Oceanobacter mangrovi]
MSIISATKPDQSATSLTLLTTDEYASWCEQNPQYQSWLAANRYEGKGLQLLPGSDGSLQALFVANDFNDVFVCGDLSAQLPASDYLLANERSRQEQFNIALGWGLGGYRFTRYKANDKPQAQLLLGDEALVDEVNRFINATALVRDLINTPAQDMMPQDLAATAAQLVEEFGGQLNEVIGDDLLDLNYPMIHAVGRASEHAPRLIDLRWGKADAPKVTLVGKGICFDTGGLNLKPGNFMRQMKKDMGGSAHALGLARLIMASGLNVQLRVLVPAAENAVAGNAFRPGDVLPTRKGLTVEIDNTDAEGRLVLCDALAEAVDDAPEIIIDFATLTGACRVALGTELPGFFSNDRQVAFDLMAAGESVSDPVWQLPLHKPYADMMKSDIADLVNSAASPFGGAITAALYLQEFVGESPWVHFDIMAWNNRKLPGRPLGGEAMGMRAVYEYLQRRYG